MDELRAVLRTEYGIDAGAVSPVAGGWSALVYKVESAQGAYFLKVYEKKRSGAAAQLERLDLCMAAASWLENHTGLTGRINAPLFTKNGRVRAETQSHAYLLFSYIEGVTLRTTPLTVRQQEELAEIVGQLHRFREMPFDFSSIRETYDIPCAQLIKMPEKPDAPLCVYRQRDMLMWAIEQAHTLSTRIKAENPPFVLCHADIHGWNLMQGDKLVLIDWESIKFAPAEADLYAVWGDWYWGDSKWGGYWDVFLPVYRRLCPGYAVREEFLRFYQIRRHIEDINDFYRQYIHDDMTVEETRDVVSSLERECACLRVLTQR